MMTKCRKCKKLINEYLNHGRPAEMKEKLDMHLSQCTSCKEYFDSMHIINSSLKALKIDYNINVKDTVLKKIAEGNPKVNVNKKVYIRYAATFACMAIVIGVYFMTGGFNNFKKNAIDTSTYESANDQTQGTRYGIASTSNPESDEIPDFAPNSLKSMEYVTVLNYVSDKNYEEIIQDINIASGEYTILELNSETAKNEISFISYNTDTDKLVEKLNLKKDTNWKSDECTTGRTDEYVKLVIVYSD
ncbi:MAG: zf-HC2 domain-containing protein [Clostridia bacterium]